MSKTPSTPTFRSRCPVAASLDLIGDRWSLIVVRDLMLRKSKYKDFRDSPEGIPTNILANRLRKLESDGILEKRPYQDNPVRFEYRLTRKGADLLPLLQQLALWGNKYIADRWPAPDWFLKAKPNDLLKSN